MTFPHFDIGKTLTLLGAAAELLGLPLVFIDYGWPKLADRMEGAISDFAGSPFKTLWKRIEGTYSGGTMGDLTPIGALLGSLGIAVGAAVGYWVHHGGKSWPGSVGIGVAAWLSFLLVVVFTLPLPIIGLSRLIAPLDRLSHGHALGLFGVIFAVVGFLVSLFHVWEIFFPCT
jgi:hypothetical protein